MNVQTEVAEGWKIVNKERINNLFFSTKVIGVFQITDSEVCLICNMRGEKMRNTCILAENFTEKKPLFSIGPPIFDSFEDMD